MTNDMMQLRGLLEKNADVEVLREMISFASQRLMELEVQARTGAGYGEKSGTWHVARAAQWLALERRGWSKDSIPVRDPAAKRNR